MRAITPLKREVSLQEIKKNKDFKDLSLVKQSRLSVRFKQKQGKIIVSTYLEGARKPRKPLNKVCKDLTLSADITQKYFSNDKCLGPDIKVV